MSRAAAGRLLVSAFILVLVGACGRAGLDAAQKLLPAKPIDINTATVAQLEQLPGIGPSSAQKIIEMRQKTGPFRRVEDLLAIRGISKKRLEQLRPYIAIPAVVPKK